MSSKCMVFKTCTCTDRFDTHRTQEWARDEALARNRREAQGLPVEYGKIYSQGPTATFTALVDEDDEDEDEDDEDDEE